MSKHSQDSEPSFSKQVANAGGNIIQVGRDYIRNVQIKFEGGNWLGGTISLIPVAVLLFMILGTVNTISGILLPQQILSSAGSLSNGSFSIIGSEENAILLLNASATSTGAGVNSISLSDIPLQDYRQGVVKFGPSLPGTGSILMLENMQVQQYNVNAEGADLTLQFESNPEKSGEFVRATLSGKVTNGSHTRTINVKLVVPFQ